METILTKEAKRLEEQIISSMASDDAEFLVRRFAAIQQHLGKRTVLEKGIRDVNEFEHIVITNLFAE
jgi:hypothetical protein